MEESYLLRTEQCPKCKAMGRDTQRDNLAVYSDGHKYCFCCKYISSDSSSYFRGIKQDVIQQHKIFLPEDCCTDYTQLELDWVAKYNLDRSVLLKHNVLHSDKGIRISRGWVSNVLLFPILDDGVQGYVARNFSPEYPKWVSKGDMKNIFNIMNGHRSTSIVLVEDVVSAIKVNMAGYTVMPVYGSNVKNRFERLYTLGYRHVILWLDPDMYSEMIRQSKYAHGLEARIVFSEYDPKDHIVEKIVEYLT